jgi:hypothetical protein
MANLRLPRQRGPVLASSADLLIGGIDDPGPPARRFNGWIDDVQIYDVALNQEAVEILHAKRIFLDQADVLVISPAGGGRRPVTVSSTPPSPGPTPVHDRRCGTDRHFPPLLGAVPLPVPAPTTVRARGVSQQLSPFPRSVQPP